VSRYIGWNIDIQGASSWYPALLATLDHAFFQPVTLTGISPGRDSDGRRGTDWFLSGCTDSGHAFWYSEKRLSVKVAATPCPLKADFLARMADALLNQRPEPASPFERFDEDLLVSFLEDRPLERSAFEECLKWTQERKFASLELRGSVNLSDSLSVPSIWDRSFDFAGRATDGTIVRGGPFVECNVSTPDEGQDRARLSVDTVFSTIWLRHPEEVRGVHSLGGRATPELADVFLARLVDLCRTIAATSVDKVTYSSLCVGDTFRSYDGDRIYQAFRSGLRDLVIPCEEI